MCVCVHCRKKNTFYIESSAMFSFPFGAGELSHRFYFLLLFGFSVNKCEKKVKFVKHLHSMQMVRDLTTTFRLCSRSVSWLFVFLCAPFFSLSSRLLFGFLLSLLWLFGSKFNLIVDFTHKHRIKVARSNLLLNTNPKYQKLRERKWSLEIRFYLNNYSSRAK